MLKGTNREIGRALTEMARQHLSVQAEHSTDPLRTRVQRHYLEKNAPLIYD